MYKFISFEVLDNNPYLFSSFSRRAWTRWVELNEGFVLIHTKAFVPIQQLFSGHNFGSFHTHDTTRGYDVSLSTTCSCLIALFCKCHTLMNVLHFVTIHNKTAPCRHMWHKTIRWKLDVLEWVTSWWFSDHYGILPHLPWGSKWTVMSFNLLL